mgnify:FL=1
MENHRYSIWYNANTGKVLRVHDKKAGKDLLTAKESEGIFSYQYDRYGYNDINEYLRTYGYHFTTWGIQDYGRENYPFCEHETCTPIYTGCERTEHGLVFNYAGEKSADEYGDAGRYRWRSHFRSREKRFSLHCIWKRNRKVPMWKPVLL